ncbi:hypothetical protein [Haloarchaeobius salinus]|uniref:hypothetical protein n=1 Tax=Haloarchaeobius salinus TaxID=1198298 RepID=UPI00210F1DDC|nr:hypothetical protein [Haloarchaeobius salinus]
MPFDSRSNYGFPNPENVLLLVLIGVAVVDVALVTTDSLGTLLAVGLILDIIGAAVLAIPDIPSLRRYTLAGGLRTKRRELRDMSTVFRPVWSAKEGVETGGLYRSDVENPSPDGEIRFERLRAVIEDEIPDDDWDLYWEDVVKFEHDSAQEDPFGPYICAIDSDKREEKIGRNLVSDILREREEKEHGKARRIGLSLLIFGFLHQMAPLLA